LGVLQRLHDAVPPTPFAQVKELVEKELQLPLAKVFGSFDETPLASASIGQGACGRRMRARAG
jgi:ubiquinone biosynthesis protein